MPILLINFLRPYFFHIVVGAAVIAVVVGGVLYIRHQGVQAEREAAFKREVDVYKEQVAKATQIAAGLEQTLQTQRAEAQQLKERLNDETSTNVVYRNCVLPVGGVQLLNQALTGKPAR